MADSLKLEIDRSQLQEAMRLLDDMAENSQEKILKPALHNAAKVVLRSARMLTPIRTGTLRRSLGVKSKAIKQTHSAYAVIGARKHEFKGQTLVEFVYRDRKGRLRRFRKVRGYDPVKYLHIVEKGTHFQPSGYLQPKLDYWHPEIPPNPFLQFALDTNRTEIIQVIEATIFHKLEKFGAR